MGIFDELNHFTNNTAFDQAQTDASTTNLPTYDSPFGENSVFSDSFNSTRELRKTHISLRDYTQKKKLSIAHEHLFRLNADQAYIQEAKNEYNNDILCGTFPTQITTYAYNITNHLKKQLETYSNNFTWFFEDNPKALNFFVYKIPFTNKVLNIVADIGSDFFDCIKLKKISNEQAITALIAAFKKNASYLEDELSYDEELIKNAITKEFNAEKAYQEIVKNLTDIFSESEAVQKILALSNGWTEELKGYKIEKKHYLPEEEDFQPLFFPVFKNDIKTDQTPIALKEFFQDYKEAYWFAMNAILCGQINAVIDEGKNVTELPKFLYEILTNKRFIKNIYTKHSRHLKQY